MYSQTPLIQTLRGGGGGGIESVLINGVSVLGGLNLDKVIAFFPQRQSKLSVIMRCPY